MNNQPITVYTKPNCPHCVEAKDYLSIHGLDYQEIDVTQDAGALGFLRSRGHRTVPQFYLGRTLIVEGGNQVLQTMDQEQLQRCLDDAF